MKLARCADAGEVFWAVVAVDDESVALIREPFDEWAPVLTRNPDEVGQFTGATRALASVELLAPVDPGREVFADGANYGKHHPRRVRRRRTRPGDDPHRQRRTPAGGADRQDGVERGGAARYLDDRAGVRCGDLLFTGSPAGIGHSSGRYLRPGDVVVGTIERLGSLINEVGPDPRA
jgi:2-keto-4-pentenoate hydratase/2-oxohepta-3-ene-1,7-dioic acid hydratase in catechol pathway